MVGFALVLRSVSLPCSDGGQGRTRPPVTDGPAVEDPPRSTDRTAEGSSRTGRPSLRDMRAALITEPGGIPVVTEIPDPVAGEGQVLLTVTGASIAPIDRLVASGTSYVGVPPYPYTPGMHGTGVTEDGQHLFFATGAGVAGRTGGSAAEKVVVPRVMTMPLDGHDDRTAAAASGSAIAAVGALRKGGLADGSTCIVLGANGVVGNVGVQWACAAGARVIAVARGEAACERAVERGAHAAVDSTSGDADEITAALSAVCPDGADVALDPVWGTPALAALRVLKPGGRLVNLGESAGVTATIPSALIRGKSLQILGWTNAVLSWDEQCAILHDVLALASEGSMVVDATVVPLDEIAMWWSRPVDGRLILVP